MRKSGLKSAFTLIELLVYMAIMGFIIVVAGRVFSDATVMRVRSQNMVKTAEQVGNAANLIMEDISQMGVKTWASSSASSYVVETKPEVYISHNAAPLDSSSFQLWRGKVALNKGACGGIISEDGGASFDSLVFRRAEFDDAGSVLLGVREIAWWVSNGCELRRSCKTLNGTEMLPECPSSNPAEVLIAKNVRKFSLYASAPGAQPSSGSSSPALEPDTIFPTALNNEFNLKSGAKGSGSGEFQIVKANPDQHNAKATVFGADLVKNAVNNNGAASNKKYGELYLVPVGNNPEYCYKVPIKKGETWAVEFNMPFPSVSEDTTAGTQFLPGQDHIAVGLRYNDQTPIPDVSKDVIFYPSQCREGTPDCSATGQRYAEFFAKAELAKPVCVALTLSFYSPLASIGTYHFRNFKVYRKPTGTYHFVKKENGYEDSFANLYATEDESAPQRTQHKKKVKAFELLLEIDQSGEVAGTYSQGTNPQGVANAGIAIPVPNNGPFNGGT